MTNNPQKGLGDRELWRRHRPESEHPAPITGFDANLVAAWLEDNLTDEDWPALEARLAANPEQIETLRAAAGLPSASAEALPAALRSRLLALDPAKAAGRSRRAAACAPLWGRLTEWAAAAAVLVAVAVVGFNLGSATTEQGAQIVANVNRADDNAAGFQVAFDNYLPTSSISFLVEGDSR
jgi:anti-sigma-K factor RskA